MRLKTIRGFAALIIFVMVSTLFVSCQKSKPAVQEMPKKEILWGVDSAQKVTSEFYGCVKKGYGVPDVWGRYLGDRENTSAGLTKEEADFLHKQGTKILLVYNHFTDATGYNNGVIHAKKAIKYAKALGVPDHVYLFADIEQNYPVDSGFILGWLYTLLASSYGPGLYGNLTEGEALTKSFTIAMTKEAAVKEKMILWNNQPNIGVTTKQYIPAFKPENPTSSQSILVWQYGIDGKVCGVDTDLVHSHMMQFLW